MTLKKPKSITEMKPRQAGVYTLSPAERASIDGLIAQAAAIEQRAQGAVQMLIDIHQLKGVWNYDRATGQLVRVPENPPATPATKEGATK